MKNSPTICQYFVVQALSPAQQKHSQSAILHYMDDLLIAAPTRTEMEQIRDSVVTEIQKAGLEISTSKIQNVPPWKYLGWRMTEQTITPQKIKLWTSGNTLQDLQQLLGEINWVRSILGITSDELAPLFDLLRGDCDIKSPRTLTPEAQASLENVTEAFQRRQAHQCAPEKPFILAVLGEKLQLYGLIFQWDPCERDPLLIMEWVFLPYKSPKTIFTTREMTAQIIIRARTRLLTLAGQDFAVIYLPLINDNLDWALQNSDDLQNALLNFSGVCSIHYPAHKLLQIKLSFREKPMLSEEPLSAVILFTDGSGKTHKSVTVWLNQTTKTWESDIQTVRGFPQITELAAVGRAFQLFPFNFITDSAYIANVVKIVEGSGLKYVGNDVYFQAFIQFYNTELIHILFLMLGLILRSQDL
ncbi:PREDICTED: endogenous retrovirus group K member 18 Pol protein-like [Pseudopodoces humilis]|uniref:endogenous retrovirus group K member 18 Pol protein-like n=1 Tax=Pseudopodoces humilis TaxID=181119 RepID=UPI0006B7E2E4|nr:PREDICTED: endogenous retrovirus group K member 18 Pol protein-like [Pseudopodoces humilis]